MSVVDIIIPTWNNPQYLYPCVQSIKQYTMTEDLFHIYIVNNGLPQHMDVFKDDPLITVLQQESNLGWEGGLKAGLVASKSPYVLFLNDDTLIPCFQRLWLNNLLKHFQSPNCAAVGPSSNTVMGRQNMFMPLRESIYRSKFLIGFCMLVRRSDLEAAGGIDDTLPGGDDLDLSIRLRKLGKYLLINREVFVWHHGFKTGTRVHSDWNSAAMQERTNHALMSKHGLHAFLDLWAEEKTPEIPWTHEDTEGNLIRQYVTGPTVIEIGCGDQKTVPNAIGIDIVSRGTQMPGVAKGRFSIADLVGDVSGELPVKDADTIIARHILEHIPNTVSALKSWRKSLRTGGRLIIAVPNHNIRNSIPMNHEHCHGFTPQGLTDLMESTGWKTIKVMDGMNYISFVGVFEANGLH